MAAMRLCAPFLAATLAGSLAVGCGGGHDIAEKQIEELEAQVGKLRAEQAALGERLERAEIALRGARPSPVTGGPQATPIPANGARPVDARPRDGDRPDLDVVHLGPEADSDDPDADTPRPVLRASGDSGVIQERAGGKVLLDDRKEGGDSAKKKPSSGAKKLAKPALDKKKQP